MQDQIQPLTADSAAELVEISSKVRLASSQVFSIRLSDAELRAIAQAARRANTKVGSFIKKAALDAASSDPGSEQRGEFFISTGLVYGGSLAEAPSAGGSAHAELRSYSWAPPETGA